MVESKNNASSSPISPGTAAFFAYRPFVVPSADPPPGLKPEGVDKNGYLVLQGASAGPSGFRTGDPVSMRLSIAAPLAAAEQFRSLIGQAIQNIDSAWLGWFENGERIRAIGGVEFSGPTLEIVEVDAFHKHILAQDDGSGDVLVVSLNLAGVVSEVAIPAP